MRQYSTEALTPYWARKLIWGAARTNNERLTLVGTEVVAVGGWCLEAAAAGGGLHMSWEEGGGRKKGKKTSDKMQQTSGKKNTLLTTN